MVFSSGNLKVYSCECGNLLLMRNVDMWPFKPVKCPKCDTVVKKEVDRKVTSDHLITGVLLYTGGIE